MKTQHSISFDTAGQMDDHLRDARVGRSLRGALVRMDSTMGDIAANGDKPFLPSQFRMALRLALASGLIPVCPYEDIGLPKLEEAK